MTLKEFQRLVKFAKKSGITEFKFGDVDVKFSPDAITTNMPESFPEPAAEPLPQYTDEEMLLWSSHGGAN